MAVQLPYSGDFDFWLCFSDVLWRGKLDAWNERFNNVFLGEFCFDWSRGIMLEWKSKSAGFWFDTICIFGIFRVFPFGLNFDPVCCLILFVWNLEFIEVRHFSYSFCCRIRLVITLLFSENPFLFPLVLWLEIYEIIEIWTWEHSCQFHGVHGWYMLAHLIRWKINF